MSGEQEKKNKDIKWDGKRRPRFGKPVAIMVDEEGNEREVDLSKIVGARHEEEDR